METDQQQQNNNNNAGQTSTSSESSSDLGYFNENKESVRYFCWNFIFLLVAVLALPSKIKDNDDADGWWDNDAQKQTTLEMVAVLLVMIGGLIGVIYSCIALMTKNNSLKMLLFITAICYFLAGLLYFVINIWKTNDSRKAYEDGKDGLSDNQKQYQESLISFIFGLYLYYSTFLWINAADCVASNYFNNGKNRLTIYLLALFVVLMIFGASAASVVTAYKDIIPSGTTLPPFVELYELLGAGGIITSIGALIGLIIIYVLLSMLMGNLSLIALLISGLLIFVGGLLMGCAFWRFLDETDPKPNDEDSADIMSTSFAFFFAAAFISFDLAFGKLLGMMN